MHFTAIIPARLASTRLPRKALADLGGRPIIKKDAERARESGAQRVCVATDHREIAQAVEQAGFEAAMTRTDHPTGTDRIAEVVERFGLDENDVVVNIQGDEPLIEPGLVRAVATLLAETPEAAIATACHPIRSSEEFFDPNAVKVVLDSAGLARYFSRAPIPWARDAFAASKQLPPELPCHRHIGIYAYRAAFLRVFPRLAVWHGYAIAVAVRQDAPAPGVDTPEDLERVRALFDRASHKR